MNTPAVKKTYRGGVALDVPALTLEPGRVHAVIGANGSGKSTLCRVLAGTLDGDGGRVQPAASIGYMPQKSYAFSLTVRKNLLLSGHDAARADALLDVLGLTGLQDRAAHRLSGGETAKMALCRVLMRDCALLILDEPTAAMDTESTLAAERLIQAYAARTGAAVLLVTHAPAQAARIAGWTLFLQNGRLVEQGGTRRLLTAPAAQETRRFLAFCGFSGMPEPSVNS